MPRHLLPLAAAVAATGPLTALAAEQEVSEVIEVTDVPTRAPKPSLDLDLRNFGLQMQDLTFPSGLRIIFQRDDTQPIIAITSVTDHGASDDPLGKEGIAHLVEHLWFRSEHGELPKVWDLLQSEMGCGLNAFTQYDITAYMTVCGSHNLDAMMKLESLRITDPVARVTEEMVTTEIEVVRNEIRMRAENYNIPFFTVWEYINKHTFPKNHPYHRPMAGDHTSIRNIKLADIQKFTEDFYRPETTTMMVVGDLPASDFGYLLHLIVSTFDLKVLDPDLEEQHIRRQPRPGVAQADPNNPNDWYLVPMNPRQPDRPLPIQVSFPARSDAFAGLPPIDPENTKLGTYDGPVEDPTVAIAWTLPPAYQGDDTLMNVTGSLVSQTVMNGLRRLADPNINLSKSQGCGALPNKRVSTMVCAVVLKDVDHKDTKLMERVGYRVADRMLDQVVNVITGWQENEMSQKIFEIQFTQARNQFLASLFNQSDLYAAVGGGRATNTAQHAHFTGSAQYFSDSMNEVLRLQAFQIAEFVDTWLKRKRATSIVILPIDRDEVAIVSGDTEGSGGHFRGGGEEAILKPSIPHEDITPEFLRELITLPDRTSMDDFTLSNGLRVVIQPHGNVPITQVELIAFGAGSSYDVDGRIDIAQRFIIHDGDFRAADQGSFSPPLDPLRFAGGWTDGMGSLTQTLGIRGSAGNLDGQLWMLRERLETTKPYLSGKGSYLNRWEKRIKRQWFNADWHLTQMRNEHLNPGHILTQSPSWDDVRALRKFSGSDVGDWWARVWQPANTVLLITGDVDPNEARSMAVKYFGGWSAPAGVEPAKVPDIPGPNPASETAIYVLDDKGKTQTQVTLVCPLKPAAESPSAPHQLLGDIASMTLFAELREEAGIVYSPQSAVFTQPGGTSMMFMSAAIQNDSAVFALSRYRAFIDKAAAGKLSARDLKVKQLSRASNYVLGQQSIDQMSGRLASVIANRQPWSSFERYADSLANVTVDDLAAITQGCNDHAFISLKGPKDVVIEQLEEAGLSYEVIDAKERGKAIYEQADPKGFKKYLKDEAKREKKKAKNKAKEESDDDASDDED